MQKQIRQRAQFYGVVAVLLAVALVAFSYNLGVPKSEFRPSPSSSLLNTFSSYEDLRSFLMVNSTTHGAFPFYGPWDSINLGGSLVKDATPPQVSTSPNLYSTTNIQVAGVDEADFEKTDGEYVYSLSNKSVFIIEGLPA